MIAIAYVVVAQAQQAFADGVAAYERGDYATALRMMRAFAARSSAEAQYNLGLMYDQGRGVTRDYGATEKWYRKTAAEQGVAFAQISLGSMYDNGQEVVPDYAEAVKRHWRSASRYGSPTHYLPGAAWTSR